MLDPQLTLNCNGQLLTLEEPKVMGILNVTPDSFYDGGKYTVEEAYLKQTERMLEEGAAVIDVGGMSSRPGAEIITPEEELNRVIPKIRRIRTEFPESIISIDTIHARIVREAVSVGASIVNDISGGKIDSDMYRTVAELGVPYILMHMQGKPSDMQKAPSYENILLEIIDFFIEEVNQLRELGVKDIVLDPGFGFGKTVEHNYRILKNLIAFRILDLPIMTGISRKSMICKVLKVAPENALNGTTALHMIALQQGSKILRVHDVKEAIETIKLWQQLESA